MSMRHVGIRPVHPLVLIDFKKKIWEEERPDGSVRIWNKRMLYSGCGNITSRVETLMGLYYCPTCKEYFAPEQWELL